MNPLSYIRSLAKSWQLSIISESEGRLSGYASRDLELEAIITDDQILRIEIVLVKRVSSARLTLWNVLHLNQFNFLLGQIIINLKQQLVLRTNLPENLQSSNWIEIAFAHALSTASGWVNLLRADHADLPLDGSRPIHAPTTIWSDDLSWTSSLAVLDANTGLHMLEHLLIGIFGHLAVRRLSARELAVADEFTCHIHLLRPRHHALPDPAVSWYIGLRTEVGCLPHLESDLVVRLNRFNAESKLIGCGLIYYQRKHLVLLSSGLPLEILQHPDLLAAIIKQHQSQAAALYEELHSPYGLRSVAGLQLGF